MMRRIGWAGLTFAAAFVTTLAAPDNAKPTFGSWGVELSNLDRSVRPGDDFYLFANGNWQKTAVIAPDRTSTGSFDDVEILSEERLGDIIQDLESKNSDALTPNERKLRDLYDGFEDQRAIDARGLADAKPDLDRIAGLNTYEDVARAMSSVTLAATSVFDVSINPDSKNPNKYAIELGQDGLGLPDRDYYLKSDPEFVKIREAYQAYLTKMLTLAGFDGADLRAKAVVDFETALARLQWDRASDRDADRTYNPMTLAQLQAFAPAFPWQPFFAEVGIDQTGPTGPRQFIVTERSAFPLIAVLFRHTPISVLRDYLTVHYLSSMAQYLPSTFDREEFAFYGTGLNGQVEQKPRNIRGTIMLDGAMGEALGQLYVARYFTPQAKAKAQALVANLMKAYENDIKTLPWMTEVTREKAIAKLHAYTLKIGYPDRWRDYTALEIKPHDPLGNTRRLAQFDWDYQLNRLDKPVDRKEWGMTPSTVNAYYDASFNEIVFPAAILQPPFFDPNADDAVNYGAIGAVIGHEISHGFDDQGSKYDGAGVLQDWWTVADRTAFEARTAALSAQYDSYEPLPGLHIIGKNTLGENIADLAGLNIALKAYRLSLEGKSSPVLDGFTGEQRFFLGFAQVWRNKEKEGSMRTDIMSDAHSDSHFRVVGVTRNMDDWYRAFDIKPTDKYYLQPEDRVRLW